MAISTSLAASYVNIHSQLYVFTYILARKPWILLTSLKKYMYCVYNQRYPLKQGNLPNDLLFQISYS